MDELDLEKAINDIAGDDGWWKRSTGETYLSAGKDLVSRGFTVEEAVNMLSSLYYAASEEFGG